MKFSEYSGLTLYDMILRGLRDNNGCTDDEAEAMAAGRIYNQSLLRRGVARRIIHDDPGELETALSLATRIEWLDDCLPSRRWDDRYPEVWKVFMGLAASDLDVSRAFFGHRPRMLSGGHKSTVLIYNTVQAIVTRNRRAQLQLRPEIEYADVPECDRAILRTLHGIIIADAGTVAVNLGRVLATWTSRVGGIAEQRQGDLTHYARGRARPRREHDAIEGPVRPVMRPVSPCENAAGARS